MFKLFIIFHKKLNKKRLPLSIHSDRIYKMGRRIRRKNQENLYASEEQRIAKEKRKARELRHSPWWKRKRATGRCYYCNKQYSPPDLTMDHIIPLSRGGASEKINLVASCKDCNNKKKNLLPIEWEEYLETLKNSSVNT